jgi:hypothetical protein
VTPRVRFNDRSWVAKQTLGNVWRDEDGNDDGYVRTPHGYVRVYGSREASSPDGWGPVTGLWFVWEGREYDRRYNIHFSRAGIVRVAARFARDIVAGRIQ